MMIGYSGDTIDRYAIAGDEGVSPDIKTDQAHSRAGQSLKSESVEVPAAAAVADANVQRMLRSMLKPEDGSDCALST